MSEIICVTNRILVKEDFLKQIEKICECGECKPRAVLLREKDLPQNEYLELAAKVQKICSKYNVAFISHTFLCGQILHLPLQKLTELSENGEIEKLPKNIKIGTSVHSVEDAKNAQILGASYLIAGHIFETNCKKGLKGRGLSFLEQVTKATKLPVYAIGGITPQNYKSVLESGAKGAAIMSSAMVTKNPAELFAAF